MRLGLIAFILSLSCLLYGGAEAVNLHVGTGRALLGGGGHVGTTYYVDTAGSDSNPGTSPGLAWQTIAHVNAQNFHPGDKVLFTGGESFSGALTYSGGGTCANPVTFGVNGAGTATISSGTANGFSSEGVAGLAISGLTFTGSGSGSNSAIGISIDNNLAANAQLSCITISSSVVTGYGGSGISLTGSNGTAGFTNVTITGTMVHDNTGTVTVATLGTAGIFVASIPGYGTNSVHSNVTISSNTVYNNTGASSSTTHWTGGGIVIGETNGALIQGNEVYSNGANSDHSGSGPVGIIAYDDNNVTAQFNETYLNSSATADGEGLDFDGGVTNSVMQYNYSHDNKAPDLMFFGYNDGTVKTWNNNTMRFNIAQRISAAANQICDAYISGTSTMTNASIYNNTLLNSVGPCTFGSNNSSTVTATVANNIFASIFTGSSLQVNPASSINMYGNDYYNNQQVAWAGTTYTTFASWQAATSQEKISGSNVGLISNPLFNSPWGGPTTHGYNPANLNEYQLQLTSPMLGAGLNLQTQFSINVGTQDYYGAAVPNAGAYNVGAGGYNPAACYTVAGVNLLTNPNLGAGWGTTHATITTNAQSAPDGTTTAAALVEDATTNQHYANQFISKPTSSQRYTFVALVKESASGAKRYAEINIDGAAFGGGAFYTLNLDTGATLHATTYGTGFGTPQVYAIPCYGYWRANMRAFTDSTNQVGARVQPTDTGGNSSYAGNGTSGIYVWGANMQQNFLLNRDLNPASNDNTPVGIGMVG